jgi:hypothetical protein
MTAGGAVYRSVVVAENPAALVIPAGAYQLASEQVDTVLIGADIADGAAAGGIRFELAQSDDVVFSVAGAPDTRVGVTCETTGDDIATCDFMSGPMTVMSADFEEYAHNYPNPFRAGSETTKISYFLTRDTNVRIDIYDLAGMHVWSTERAAGTPGGTGSEDGTWCEIEWDGRNGAGDVVRNGVYICRIQAGSQSATFKIAVAK